MHRDQNHFSGGNQSAVNPGKYYGVGRQSGDFSWVCPNCHTINQTDKCVVCGYVRTVKPVSGKSAGNPWKTVCLLLIALLVVGIFAFSGTGTEGSLFCIGGHTFSDATCTDPKTCSECGKTEGVSLGHNFSPATCSGPSRCSRCGETTGTALSHNWVEATYVSPRRCTLCGQTTGTVKGYYATLPGSWNTKRVSVGGTNTTPWVLDDTVNNCVGFTMYFQLDNVKYGDIYGKFTVYAKISGKWKKLGTFNVNDNSEVVKTFTFDDPISFKQLAFVGPHRVSFSYNFSMWLEDWYLLD